MAGRTRPMPTRTRPSKLAVVHNGIIENFRELRAELQARATSSRPRPTPRSSRIWSPASSSAARRRSRRWRRALPRLRGAFALAFLFQGEEDLLIGARTRLAAGGRLRRRRDVSRLRRAGAGALHRISSPIWRRATGSCSPQGRDILRQGQQARSSGAPSASRPAPSWSRRATTATSWPRKSTSSRRSSATR